MSEESGPNLVYGENGKTLELDDDEQVCANGTEEKRTAGGTRLSPNEEFEYLHCSFEIDYAGFRAEELPYTAYLEYMHMEEVYAKCNPPTSENGARMAALRDVTQRYAEANRQYSNRTTIKNIKAERLVKAEKLR